MAKRGTLRVLVFTAGNAYQASSKYRAFLLGRYVQEQDPSVEWRIVEPSTKELSGLSYGKQFRLALSQARLIFFGGYDVLFAQRAVYNKFIFVFLMIAALLRVKPLIFDLDDAIFLHLPFKTKWLCRAAKVCVGGSAYICEYMRRYNAHVLQVPTVIKFSEYESAPLLRKDASIPTIGWLGYGPGYFPELSEFAPALRSLCESGVRFKFLLIGALEVKDKYAELFKFIPTPDLEIIEYIKAEDDTALVPYFARMDIGIMPLFDDEWNKGKCALKAIQYMASGAPVVLARVGENTVVVEDGKTGMLALTQAEWVAALRSLIEDPDKRRKLGAAGRDRIRDAYSYEHWTPVFIQLLKDTSKLS